VFKEINTQKYQVGLNSNKMLSWSYTVISTQQ